MGLLEPKSLTNEAGDIITMRTWPTKNHLILEVSNTDIPKDECITAIHLDMDEALWMQEMLESMIEEMRENG